MGRHCIGDAVGEIILPLVAAEILERKDDQRLDRGLCRPVRRYRRPSQRRWQRTAGRRPAVPVCAGGKTRRATSVRRRLMVCGRLQRRRVLAGRWLEPRRKSHVEDSHRGDEAVAAAWHGLDESGLSAESSSASRSFRTALFNPTSKSTKVSAVQSAWRSSSRVTTSPARPRSTFRIWKDVVGRRTFNPCRRSSPESMSSSKTPNRRGDR